MSASRRSGVADGKREARSDRPHPTPACRALTGRCRVVLTTARRRYHTATAGWSSSVARWAHNPEVVGSNPTPATTTEGLLTSAVRSPSVMAEALRKQRIGNDGHED